MTVVSSDPTSAPGAEPACATCGQGLRSNRIEIEGGLVVAEECEGQVERVNTESATAEQVTSSTWSCRGSSFVVVLERVAGEGEREEGEAREEVSRVREPDL